MNGQFTHHDWNSIQFYDDAFLTRGTQSLKFGFALERMRYNPFQKYNPEGIVRFGSLAQFLTNQPNSFEGGFPDRIIPRGHRQTLFGGYIQDDWRVRPRLTLNVGLRYEMTTVLNEVHGLLTNLSSMSAPVTVLRDDGALSHLHIRKAGLHGRGPLLLEPHHS